MSEMRFAVVVDNEVAATLSIDDETTDSVTARLIPAFLSDPKIVQVSIDVQHGWTWNGTEFVAPAA